MKKKKKKKKSQIEVMEPTTSNIDSQPIFPYYIHNQAGFDNSFINRGGFIDLGVLKMSFTF